MSFWNQQKGGKNVEEILREVRGRMGDKVRLARSENIDFKLYFKDFLEI